MPAPLLWPPLVALLTCCAPHQPPVPPEAPLSFEKTPVEHHKVKPAEVKSVPKALHDVTQAERKLRDTIDRYYGPKP